MRKLLSFLAIFFVLGFFSTTSVAAATLFEDDFSGADGTTIQANNSAWQIWPGDLALTRISSNQAVKDGGHNSAYIVSSLNLQDACMQVDYIIRANTQEFLNLTTRSAPDGSGTRLVQFWFNGDGTGFTHAYGPSIDTAGTFPTGISNGSHQLTLCEIGSTMSWYIDGVSHGEITDPNPLVSGYVGFSTGIIGGGSGLIFDNFKVLDSNPFVQAENVIAASPTSGNITVGTPFSVNVLASSASEAFNALRANVSLSSNLTVTGLSNSTSNSCNLQYTTTPSFSNLSFAGGILGSSSSQCTVYTLTLTPNATGQGTLSFTNASMKAYSNSSEILTSVDDASFTISEASPTPTPEYSEFTLNPVLPTYASTYTLMGSKNSSIAKMFVNSSDANSVYPTTASWENLVSLVLGANVFEVYGENSSQVPTATQSITVNRHTLGDINGDSAVDLIDVSLFAVDWDKTENLTYNLSDMNSDGVVDLTDLSILAKLL